MYNPDLGTFTQRDPIGYEGGINLYEYVGDDPMVQTDPSGNAPFGPLPLPAAPSGPTSCIAGCHGVPHPPRSPFADPDGLYKQLCKNGCSNCSLNDVKTLVNTIQYKADTTCIIDFGMNGCQRWVFAFENNLRDFHNPCIKERNVGWEPSNAIGGGHAIYRITLCDGTIIQLDHWVYYGGTRIRVITPPPTPVGGDGNGSTCPRKCE
jgi:hypothetical protein